MIYILACQEWFKQPSFDHWYLTLSFLGVYLTFVEAVILILKHTTFLRLSTPELTAALTQAELDYQVSNIDLKIEEYLKAFSSSDASVVQFADFIKATEIGVFVLLSVTTMSYQKFSIISALSENRGIDI
jgi:hypothetical protein